MRARRAEWGKSHVHSHTHTYSHKEPRAHRRRPRKRRATPRPSSISLPLAARYMGRYDLVGSPDECFSAASLANAWSVVARRVSEAADPMYGQRLQPSCARGCSPMCRRLQPYAPRAAPLRATGCSPMYGERLVVLACQRRGEGVGSRLVCPATAHRISWQFV